MGDGEKTEQMTRDTTTTEIKAGEKWDRAEEKALAVIGGRNKPGARSPRGKYSIVMAVTLLVFAGVMAVAVFFVTIRGEEETMVPDVTGEDLTAALLKLQVKELYPRIQLRYSQSSTDKGLVLEQDPLPGTIVRAGRRIRLVVSQGVVVNTMENYVGRNIDDVRMDLQALFASEGNLSPLIKLKEPLLYEYSAEPPGAILQQKPLPGTSISGPTTLELVVSRGPEDTYITVPAFLGLSLEDALDRIELSGVDFTFTTRTAGETDPLFAVAAQDPPEGASVKSTTRVTLTLAVPADGLTTDGLVFNVFRYEMAKNPYPLDLRLEARLPTGERRSLLHTAYAGGPLAVPYRLPSGTTLTLSMLNGTIHEETVTPR